MTTNVMADFAWYMRATWRNRRLQFTKRIKSPRYAVALFLGAGYFILVFIMPMVMGESPGRRATSGGIIAFTRSLGALAIALLSASWWLWRTDREGITLTPAEANLLVPAPVTRKQLVQFKLLILQGGLLISALIVSLLTHRSHLPWPSRFLSSFVLFNTLQLHRFGASLVHTSLAEQGRSGWRRVWPAALLFAAVLGGILVSVLRGFLAHTGVTVVDTLLASLTTPPASIALAPFRAVLAPMNAATMAEWWPAIVIASLIVLGHYFWVIRMDAAFEEGAAAAGVKRAAMIEAAREGRGASFRNKPTTSAIRAPWFALKPHGHPTGAILWKNILGVTRGMSRRMLSIAISVIIGFMVFVNISGNGNHKSGLDVVGVMALSYGFMVTLMGPVRIRHDFRTDLRRIQLLRTLPVGGGRLAAMEITTSTVVLSLAQLSLLAIGVGCLFAGGKITHTGLFIAIVPPTLIALFAMNGTMIVVHNWFAITYPAWAGQKPGGIEMFGTMMLVMIGTLVFLVLSLLGPILVAGVAAVSMAPQWGSYSYIPAVAAGIITLYAQLGFLINMLGNAYDKMDPADSLLH